VVAQSEALAGAPLIFAGYGDHRVRMWSLESGTVKQEYTGHSKRITCMAILNPKAASIQLNVSNEMPEAIKRLKDIEQHVKEEVAKRACCGLCACCCSEDEKKKAEKAAANVSQIVKIQEILRDDCNVLSRETFVVCGSEDGCVRLFHAATSILVRVIETKGRSPVHSIALILKTERKNVQDSEPMLATGCKNGIVQLWHLDTGRLMRTLSPHPSTTPTPILALNLTGNKSVLRPISTASNLNSSESKICDANVLVTAGGDRSVCIRHLRDYLDEAVQCYMQDQQKRLPRAEMSLVPEAFSKWPRVYLLSRKFGSMDEFFSGKTFALFIYAMQDDRLDFISTFLPHAPSGLLIGSRKSALERIFKEAQLLHEIREQSQADSSWYKTCKYFASGPVHVMWTFAKTLAKKAIFEQALLRDPAHIAALTEENRRSSLLYNAVERKNVLVVRIVLDVWLHLLQTPPRDLLEQSGGPAMCLSKRDLMHVAEVFPSEFEHFVCSLSLVPVHSSISQSCSMNLGPEKMRKEKGSNGSFLTDIKMWNSSENDRSQEPYTCLYLPLRQAADLDMIETYVKTCTRLKSLKIYTSDVGITTNHYAWGTYAMHVHRTSFICYWLDCAVFLLYVFTTDTPEGTTYLSMFLYKSHTLCIAYMGFHLMARLRTELQRVLFSPNSENSLGVISTVLQLFTPWRIFDAVWLICRLKSSQGSDPILLAFSSLMQWVRLMYYLRAFESTGLLVAMILRIVSEIRFYIFIILVIVFFFSESLWVINSPDISRPFDKTNSELDDGDDADRFAEVKNAFGNQGSALITSFTFIFGNYQPAFFGHLPNAELRRWSVLISVAFMFTVCVLMFNLLIAFMSDIFVRMSSEGRSQWSMMQAKTIYEDGYAITNKYRELEQHSIIAPKLIHVLRRTSDMTLDSLKQSLEETDAESITTSLVKHTDKMGSEIASKTMTNEKEILERLQMQQLNLDAMIKLLSEVTANPSSRTKSESNTMPSLSSAPSANAERRGSVRL